MEVLFDSVAAIRRIGESGDTRGPLELHNQYNTMNTTLQLPQSAADAVNQLQARRQGLRSLLPTGSFPFDERHEADCRHVPAGFGSGAGFINHAINEIDETIAEIIKRCLVDRNWRD